MPYEAWRRARSAALDSGLAFKDYMACLMLTARPLARHETDEAVPAASGLAGDIKARPPREDGR